MIDFSPITNEELRQLAQHSAAVASLSEPEQQAMIMKIAQASDEEQASYVAVFEKESQDLQDINQHEEGDLAEAVKEVDEASSDIQHLEKDYDTSVRISAEADSRALDDAHTADILTQLQSL